MNDKNALKLRAAKAILWVTRPLNATTMWAAVVVTEDRIRRWKAGRDQAEDGAA